ncbi:MAG TPA: hypothetical protein VIC04_09610, partial [Terriglobia bacterium]
MAFAFLTFLFLNLAAAVGITLQDPAEGNLRAELMQTSYLLSIQVLWEGLMLLFVYYVVTG